jgi:hypothetical protein
MTERRSGDSVEIICIILAPLASLKEQEKYIVHGTKDEYLLPEELLERAWNLLAERTDIALPASENLAHLRAAVEVCDVPEEVSNEQLVRQYEPWLEVRARAKAYLEEIGFDLEAYERDV